MSASPLPLAQRRTDQIGAAEISSSSISTPTWQIVCAIVGLFLISFICEQNVRISTQFAYTQTLDEMTDTAEGGNALRRLSFLLLGGTGCALGLASLHRRWKWDFAVVFAFLAVIGWCCASVLWSIDAGMTIRRLIVFLCCALAAVGMGRYFTLREICYIGFCVTLLTAVVGVLAELACGTFRPWSGDYRFSGTIHPNTQGVYLGMLVLSSFTLFRTSSRHRGFYLACFVGGGLLLLLTKSRTANAAAIVAMAALWLAQVNFRWPALLAGGTAWLGGVALLLAFSVGIDPQENLGDALLLGRKEQTESFTGRGEIWPVVSRFIEKEPWTGYGFESFWTPAHIAYVSDAVEWPVREAHCGYLELMLHLGWLGLLFVLLFVGLSGWNAARAYVASRDPSYLYVISLLLFGLFDSTMESGMVTPQTVVLLIVTGIVNLATQPLLSPSHNACETPRKSLPASELLTQQRYSFH